MKLASLKTGGRDGTLVVVDRRLERAVCVPQIAATLQQALERWNEVSGPLAVVAQELEAGKRSDAFAFDPFQAASPLPRAYSSLMVRCTCTTWRKRVRRAARLCPRTTRLTR